MPSTEEMLKEVQKEAKYRNLSARALARMTGLHNLTVGNALRGAKTTRPATIVLLYTKVILERDSINTPDSTSAPEATAV